MTTEQIKQNAIFLSILYGYLCYDRTTKRYNVEDHNLCIAIIERNGVLSPPYIAYSNMSRLSVSTINEYGLITDVPDKDKLLGVNGMDDHHTEIRLLNYLYASGILNEGNATIFLFSTRTVCSKCANSINVARQFLANAGISIVYYSLKCEEKDILDKVYSEQDGFIFLT